MCTSHGAQGLKNVKDCSHALVACMVLRGILGGFKKTCSIYWRLQNINMAVMHMRAAYMIIQQLVNSSAMGRFVHDDPHISQIGSPCVPPSRILPFQ